MTRTANTIALRHFPATNADFKRIVNDVIFTIITYNRACFTAYITVVWGNIRQRFVYHCVFYVLPPSKVDYSVILGYTDRDYLSIEPREKWRISWPVNKMTIS